MHAHIRSSEIVPMPVLKKSSLLGTTTRRPQTPDSTKYDPRNTKPTATQNDPQCSKGLINIIMLSDIAQALFAIPTGWWSHLTVILHRFTQPRTLSPRRCW